jgi:hypothetical protein
MSAPQNFGEWIGTVLVISLVLAGVASGIWQAIKEQKLATRLNEKVEKAQKKAEEHPDKAAPAWELAQATLDKYFQRNLNQVKWIFVVAIFVMLSGFAVILYGVALAGNSNDSEPSRIAALAGIITEFIGATFIWVYKSTMQQATGFMKILDRINTVGMAVQIVDSMPRGNEEGSLKNKTRADLVALLMATPTLNPSAEKPSNNRRPEPTSADNKEAETD